VIEIVPARPTHIGPIATRMRDMDRLECMIFGHTPKSAIRNGLLGASMAWTALIDGRAEAIFGVSTTSLLEGSGRPWMLMTDEAVKHAVSLVRFGRIYTEAIQRHYALLHNWVHAENDASIRWLSRLGFAVGSVDVINGHPMRPFVRSR
jgi:hypothetical protein